jgi:hypothetical protein
MQQTWDLGIRVNRNIIIVVVSEGVGRSGVM